MDSTVLLFALGVSLLTGVIFGIGPALSTSRANVADALKDEARTTSGSGGRGMRRVLVISETAMALVLLVGAGLLLRGFLRLQKVEPGFNSHSLVTFAIQLPAARYEETPKQTEFRRELLRRLNSLPGVQAAMVSDAPLNGNELTHNMAIDGRAPVAVGDEPEVDSWCVMGDFFQTMQIPLRAGRLPTEEDRDNQLPIAVVNEAFVKEFFAKQDVLGQRIRWAREHTPRWMTIVGVVGDVKQFSLSEAAAPAVYTPFVQSNEAWRRWMTVVLRTSGASAGLISEVKQQLWSIDSQIPVNHVETMDQLVEESLAQQKFNMLLLGIFAALALVLAAVGIYGVMSYHVSQRTREIGIRMALGARGGDVLKMVAREGLWMTATGIVIGVAAALLLTRWMSSLLFEVTPSDPSTFAGVILVMGAVAMLACYIPGRRAVRVDPLVALRYE
jgi:putative ABC transport system permease protein